MQTVFDVIVSEIQVPLVWSTVWSAGDVKQTAICDTNIQMCEISNPKKKKINITM